MSNLKICRICLRTEAKMYNFNRHQLKFFYEEVMALKVDEEDGLPRHFCYECAIILHKFHKFKEKCYIGQNILKEMLWRGPITYGTIYKIDRDEKQLNSSLSIMSVTKHVKTFKVDRQDDDDSVNVLPKKENCRTVLHKIENVEVDHFSEASLTDREDDLTNDEEMTTNDNILNTSNINVDDEIYSDDKRNIGDEQMKNDDDTINIDDDSNNAANISINTEAENGIVEIKTEYVKLPQRKHIKTNNGKGRIRHLRAFEDKKLWKTSVLSEEDALKEFRAKAEDKKYLAAAFRCEECFKGFSKKEMLDRHIQLRHIEELGNQECHFCGYRFKQFCYLKKHIKQHYTRYTCLRCDMQCCLENTALLHEEYHSGVTRKCTYCDEVFRHSSTYYTHLRTHRSQHVCALCGASFVSKLGLQQHKHIKHVIIEIESPDDDEDVNTFCKRCDMRFETRRAYEEHLFHSALHSDEEGRSTHVEKANVERGTPADNVSASKKVLSKRVQAKITNELRRRSGIEDQFSFKRKVNRRHKKKERRTRTKPTTCHHCGEHFETQAACMKHHTEAHPGTSFHPPGSRYICEICGSSLAPGSITTHQNMHTREKLHTCDTCGRQFHAQIGLKRHMVTHTGEKPYACPLCDKRFTQSNSMKLHYRTFHLKQPYPKRNRRTKKDEPKESVDAEESNSESSSDESLPDQTAGETLIAGIPDRGEDSIHYLTLT